MSTFRRAEGFTLIGLLAIVTLLSIGAMVTLSFAQTVTRRAAESELIEIGGEFSRALQSYYYSGSAGTARYPRSLDLLVMDERFAVPKRHLRRIYRDPMTGLATWGSVLSPDGGIMAVYSLSADEPLRKDIPPSALSAPLEHEEAQGYSRWIFGFQDVSITKLPVHR
jgi:type II secretory pathway pseudopilin PulG